MHDEKMEIFPEQYLVNHICLPQFFFNEPELGAEK